MLYEGGDIEDASYCLLYVIHPVVILQQRAVKALKVATRKGAAILLFSFLIGCFLRIDVVPLLKSVRMEVIGH